MATVLLTRPANDPVAVELSAWAAHLKTHLPTGAIHSFGTDLASASATRSAVDAAMPSHEALVFFGHGTATKLLGASVDLVDTANVPLMANHIVVTIACWSAKSLGTAAIGSGVAAYLGFDDKLLWLTGDPDTQFEPAICSGLEALLNGHTIATAFSWMQTELQNVVNYYHSGAGRGSPNSILGFLAAFWNSQHLAALGNQSQTI